MNYRTMGRSGLVVSELALGTMNFGTATWGCDEPTSRSIIDAYLDAGGNFVDLANVYAGGESELIVGRALKGRRDAVVLATKCSAPSGPEVLRRGSSRRNIVAELEESLRRLQTDYVDLFYLHLWDPTTPFRESLSALTDLVRTGKVRYLGVSNYSGWQISEMAALAKYGLNFEPIVSVQDEYSLISRSVEYEVVPACLHNGVGLVCFSPLAGGVLAGVYASTTNGPPDERYTAAGSYAGKFAKFYLTDRNLALYQELSALAGAHGRHTVELSIAWLLHRPAVTSVLVGPRSREQLAAYLSAGEVRLEDEVRQALDALSKPELPHPYSNQARYIPEFFGSIRHG